jgi:outer membrane protein assembly factor BamB
MKDFSMSRTILLLAIWFSTSHISAGENWTQFRGPTGDGRAQGELPLEIGKDNVRWEVEIHGKGWSSPVVWGDQIWMTTASLDGKQMSTVCVDRESGKITHDILLFENENPRYCHPTNSYASPTPVIQAGRLFAHFGSYGTCCVDTKTGQKIWERRDLPCDHWRGPGSSPVVDGDRLFVAYDGYDQQYMVALDTGSGKTVWKKDRNIDYGTDNGDRKKAYSTAIVIDFAGRRQVVSPSAADTISYDPATGAELWRVRHGGMNSAVKPLFGHGLVYITAGDGGTALVAVRPDGSGDVTKSHIAWGFGKSVPKRPSQILSGDHLYMINDEGVASCLEAKTAKIMWQKRVGGKFRASPIVVGGNIYCFSLNGEIKVFAASPEYKLVAEGKLGDGFQASPAVVGDSMILRSLTHLYYVAK